MFHLGVECATQKEIDQHLTLGMQLLSRGQYSDALSHFHAAVGKYSFFEGWQVSKLYPFTDADPNNYMSYYKRATVFLALSRSRPALADLDKVIQLKSDFQAVSVHKLYFIQFHFHVQICFKGPDSKR